MKKLQLAIMAVVLIMAVQARASWYDITFTGGGSAANGQIDVVGGVAISGFLDITAGGNSGTYALTPGSGSNGQFIWDNLVNPANVPFVDNAGLYFTGGGIQVNLFSTTGYGYGYSLYGYPPAWVPQVDNGTATISLAAVPEPTTMIAGALLLLPFGASTLRILRKRTA
jgi:hypothetical protein